MFRKRNLRKPGADVEDDANGAEGHPGASSAPPAPKPAPFANLSLGRAEAPRGASLSFIDEDDNEEKLALQKLKKKDKDREKTKGQKFTARVDVPLPAPEATSEAAAGPAAAARTGVGEYSAEALAELRKNTYSLGAPPRPKKEDAPLIRLTGAIKPSGGAAASDTDAYLGGAALLRPGQGAGAASRGYRAEREDDLGPGGGGAGGAARREDGPAGPPGGAAAEEEEEEEEDLGETIRRAKEQRERLRNAGFTSADFIPMSLAGGGGGGGGAGGRLSRRSALRRPGGPDSLAQGGDEERPGSEDEDAEFEDRGKVRFWSSGASKPGPLAGTGEDEVEVTGAEEGDSQFITEQIRKGTGGHGPSGGPTRPAGRRPGPSGPPGAPVRGNLELVAEAARAAPARVLAALQQLRLQQQQTQKQLQKVASQTESTAAGLTSARSQLAAASDRYVFVQGLRDYIAALCDCLQDKTALVEELEEHLRRAREERAAAARAAQRDLLAEDVRRGQVAVSAALQALLRAAPPHEVSRDVQAAWRAAEDAALKEEVARAPLDEFGRPTAEAAMARLEASRARRESDREASLPRVLAAFGLERQPGGALRLQQGATDVRPDWDLLLTDAIDALSDTGDASAAAPEAAAYLAERREVLGAAATAFSDTVEDFAGLAAVKQRAEEWKARHPTAYRDAYFPDSAPALFSPYVRLQLLAWEPLYPETGLGPDGGAAAVSAFDQLPWYEALFDFGQGLEEKFPDASPPIPADDDPDNDLLPRIVDKVVLPWAQHAAEKCFDPASTVQAERCVQMLTDLLVYVSPATSEGLQAILRSLGARISEAAASLLLPAWPYGAVETAPDTLLVTGLRAFFRALRLLRGACSLLRPMLPTDELRTGVLQELLVKKMVPFLRSMLSGPELGQAILPACIQAVARAVEGLAPQGGTPIQAFPDEIRPLADVALAQAKTIASQSAAAGGAGAKPKACLVGAAERGRRLCAALESLGDRDAAAKVGELVGVRA